AGDQDVEVFSSGQIVFKVRRNRTEAVDLKAAIGAEPQFFHQGVRAVDDAIPVQVVQAGDGVQQFDGGIVDDDVPVRHAEIGQGKAFRPPVARGVGEGGVD